MRPVATFGKPPSNAPIEAKVDWLMTAITDLLMASQDDPEQIYDSYQVAHPPASPVRTLDVSTATLADVKNVFATLLADWHKRGVNRGQG